jgi:hypothetical protein
VLTLSSFDLGSLVLHNVLDLFVEFLVVDFILVPVLEGRSVSRPLVVASRHVAFWPDSLVLSFVFFVDEIRDEVNENLFSSLTTSLLFSNDLFELVVDHGGDVLEYD